MKGIKDLGSEFSDLAFGSITNILQNIYSKTEAGNSFLSSITQSLEKLVDKIDVKLSSMSSFFVNMSDKNMGQKQTINFTMSKKSSKAFSDIVTALTKHVKPKTVDLFLKIVDGYERVISDDNNKKLLITKVTLTAFSVILRLVAFLLDGVKDAFIGVSVGIGLLTLMLILPPFQIGTAYLLGFLFAVKRIMTGKDGLTIGLSLGSLSRSIILMGAAIYLIGKISWANVYKLLFFLMGLAGVLRLFKKTSGDSTRVRSNKFAVTGMLGLGIGLSLLVLSIDSIADINFQSAGALIVFIAGLGLTIAMLNKINKSGTTPFEEMFSFGTGITLMVFALSMVGILDWGSVFKLLTFIAGLGLVIALSKKLMGDKGHTGTRNVKKSMNFSMGGMFGFAAGLALLVLTIAVVGELDWVPALKLLAFIAALGLAIAAPGFLGKGSGNKKSGMMSFALGVAILVLTIHVIKELDWTPAGFLIGFIVVISMALEKLTTKKIVALYLLGGGIAVYATAMYLFSLVNITVEQILTFGLATALMIGIMFLASKMIGSILIGSLGLIAVGGASLIIALLLYAISKINIDPIQFGIFLLTITALTLAFIFLTPLFGMAITGAGMALVLGLAALLVAAPLMMIQGLTFENVGAFLLAIAGLAIGFFGLLPMLAGGIISATLLVVIATGALLTAGALMAISELELKQKGIDAFNLGISSMIKTFNSFGVIEVGKAVIKSVALIPILAVALAAGLLFKLISELNISQPKIENYANVLRTFVTLSVDAIKDSVPGLKKIQPGLKALSQLVGVGGQLVDVIKAFANMQYNEYEVKDGKLVLKSVRTLTDDEIKKVGPGLGRLIATLLGPMAIISSDDDTWDFGNGVKVKNPFKGGWFGDNDSGANRIKMIGDAYGSLVGVMNNFKTDEVGNEQGKQNIVDMVTGFVNVFADEVKWKAISQNIRTYGAVYRGVAKYINSINIDKLLALERTLKLMTDNKVADRFDKLIEKLKELIGLLKVEQDNVQTSSSSAVSSGTGAFGFNFSNTDAKEKAVEKAVEKESFQEQLWKNIEKLLTEISESADSTSKALAGKLKVAIINNEVNEYKNVR